MSTPIYDGIDQVRTLARKTGELTGRSEARKQIRAELQKIVAGRSVKKDLEKLIEELR